MASNDNSIPQLIGTVLGAACKAFIDTSVRTGNRGHYSGNRNKNAHRNVKENTKEFVFVQNPRGNVHSKKVVKTLEKLVDAKDEALRQETIRRQNAEQELKDIQQQLKTVQVRGNTKEQVNSAVKKDAFSGQNKPHWRPDGKRGGWHRRGGYNTSNRANNRTDCEEPGQPGHSKLNNSNNFKSDKQGCSSVYNKQPFEQQVCYLPSAPQSLLPPHMIMYNSLHPVAANVHQNFQGTSSQFQQNQQIPNQGYVYQKPQKLNFCEQSSGPENTRGSAHNNHYRTWSDNRKGNFGPSFEHYRKMNFDKKGQKKEQNDEKHGEKGCGNQGNKAYNMKKGNHTKQNDTELGALSKSEEALQIFLKLDIPTEEEVGTSNISMDQPMNEITLIAKDKCFVPSTRRDMINFKKKYPDAKAILIQEDDI